MSQRNENVFIVGPAQKHFANCNFFFFLENGWEQRVWPAAPLEHPFFSEGAACPELTQLLTSCSARNRCNLTHCRTHSSERRSLTRPTKFSDGVYFPSGGARGAQTGFFNEANGWLFGSHMESLEQRHSLAHARAI